MLTNWADGPSHITQCPLSCGESYTYEFTVANQRGTYFWHAHVHWLRATVYGAFIVHSQATLPYSKPTAEKAILFGKYPSHLANLHHTGPKTNFGSKRLLVTL